MNGQSYKKMIIAPNNHSKNFIIGGKCKDTRVTVVSLVEI